MYLNEIFDIKDKRHSNLVHIHIMHIWNIYNMCACTEIELNFDRLFQAENILVNEITGHSF